MTHNDDVNELATLKKALRTLIDQLTEPEEESDPNSVAAQIRQHFNEIDVDALPILTESLESWDLPNLQLALDELFGPVSDAHRILGLPSQVRHYGDVSFGSLLEHEFAIGPLQFTNVSIGVDEVLPCLEQAVHLVLLDGKPAAVFSFIGEEHGPGGGGLTVQVLAASEGSAAKFLDELRDAIARNDVYRGKVITVQADRYGRQKVVFAERPQLSADDLVLPDGVLDRIQNHIVGPTVHRELLVAQGQHLSRGLLLWGPPGTGKTHTVRYLTGCLTDATIILLSGGSLGMVGGFAGLARRLAPAVVVLEDVDLVASQRVMHPMGHGNSVLFELMDQMSGHGEDADIAFVLTTNMPEALEPALAARPGRVDLAVEIPLPDAAARRKLFEVYTTGLNAQFGSVDEFVDQTEGVTASFVRELVRKAALNAATAGQDVVTDEFVSAALTELLNDTSALTRTLLGVGGSSAVDGDGTGMPHSAASFLTSFPTTGVDFLPETRHSRGHSS